ncbi:energy transducer TonB [Methylotuvimicrobium alcaliphilum]|uniref:Protein TonB n=1 Tax=Methylotuvimicrobium alcaliphilum (strain DSM 19304 / NCIMB 14124 / VKM B-2133 / 20Z) TaxID=1091494 RepID=G4SYP7_META2|nr:energy transducer TonB [Methylotuvimicrobium alcaliphilum]CCE23233.1 putative TonB-dependent membrane protein [Methylotuvimicrobium alcaliphilum 20Z]
MSGKLFNWYRLERGSRHSFLADSAMNGRDDFSPKLIQIPATSRCRPISVALATLVVTLLHGFLLFWYVTKPAPVPFSAAAPLPMISMELSAPPAPVANQALTPPKPEIPKKVAKPKPDKPKVKPKPKLRPAETAVKQVEVQKEEQESAPSAAAALQSQQHDAMAAPRNDIFVPADSNAAYLNNPKPVYPMYARRRGWEGTVVLRVHVGADGHTQRVTIQRSSGHDVLDESAMDAVKEWRFVPAKRGEIAEASWVKIPIVFHLK